MTDKKDFEVLMVDPKDKDDSTLNNNSTSSCELVDVTIDDARNNKVNLILTM